jgi:hypothetical protein
MDKIDPNVEDYRKVIISYRHEKQVHLVLLFMGFLSFKRTSIGIIDLNP